VKNVANPPRISREIVEPRAEIAKKRSKALSVLLTREEWQPRSPAKRAGNRIETGLEARLNTVEQEWHPDPEPIETNDTAAVGIGTAVWAIALIVLLIFRPAPEQTWWIYTCATGVAFGLFGLWFVNRRASRR
jgi:hypothetical protein